MSGLRSGQRRAVLTATVLGAAVLVGYYLYTRARDRKAGLFATPPANCPGVGAASAGVAEACQGCPNRGICASGQQAGEDAKADAELIAEKLSGVGQIILVLSGKGGVGKSTIATQMAWELERRGKSVGLMDIDICGPSIPRMTGTRLAEVKPFSDGWLPVVRTANLLVMSVGYLTPEEDSAVIWRGPKKNGLIKQFLSDVYWGELDYLIVDTPPGTSDEHLSVVTYLQPSRIAGAVLVTTPQEVSLQDVRKEINFCRQTQIRVLGVVENMSKSLFASGGGAGAAAMCAATDTPFAGQVDLDGELLLSSEEGRPPARTSAAAAQIRAVVDRCLMSQ